jgi:RNA polymerase sigma factor (TIGR02999 family)
VIADDNILLRTVYDELRGLAAAMLADQRPGHTLQPTALVNEAYVRMLRQSRLKVDSRAHFFNLAAKVMRQVLVDYARAKGSKKRGGSQCRVTLDGQEAAAADGGVDILALDDALSALSALDERKGRLVELRVFAGMSLDEAAEALGVARSTAALDWRFVKAWLGAQLGTGPAA